MNPAFALLVILCACVTDVSVGLGAPSCYVPESPPPADNTPEPIYEDDIPPVDISVNAGIQTSPSYRPASKTPTNTPTTTILSLLSPTRAPRKSFSSAVRVRPSSKLLEHSHEVAMAFRDPEDPPSLMLSTATFHDSHTNTDTDQHTPVRSNGLSPFKSLEDESNARHSDTRGPFQSFPEPKRLLAKRRASDADDEPNKRHSPERNVPHVCNRYQAPTADLNSLICKSCGFLQKEHKDKMVTSIKKSQLSSVFLFGFHRKQAV